MKKIGVASDHAGYELKELVVGYLDSLGYEVFDYGCNSPESCNYADYGHALGRGIDSGEVSVGVGICGSANGISMTLNKHQNVRAALCWEREIAQLARQHNNANVLTMPARFVDNTQAVEILETFLNTEFEGGRHQDRIDQIPIRC